MLHDDLGVGFCLPLQCLSLREEEDRILREVIKQGDRRVDRRDDLKHLSPEGG